MSEIHLTVSDNGRALIRAFRDLADRQLPFAVAKAMTETAGDARDLSRMEMARVMMIRVMNKAGPYKRLTIDPARKKDYPHTVARVGTMDQYIADHMTGAVRPGKKSRRTLPGEDNPALEPTGKTARGKIPKRWTSKSLLRGGPNKGGPKRRSGGGSLPRGFIVDLKDGRSIVLGALKRKRTKKTRAKKGKGKNRNVRHPFLATHMWPQTIRQRFDFERVAMNGVRRTFDKHFEKALIVAMLGAKKSGNNGRPPTAGEKRTLMRLRRAIS